MRTYFPRRWHLGTIAILVLAAVSVQLSVPQPVAASHGSSLGRSIGQTNYGAAALMGTTNPSVGSYRSGETIKARRGTGGTLGYIGSGWSKSSSCGSTPKVSWQRETSTGLFTRGCNTSLTPSGDKNYYVEHNGANLYWYAGYEGMVIMSVSYQTMGWTAATRILAFGYTSHTSSTVQLGGASPPQAIYISNIKYKPGSNSTPSQWQFVKTAGSSISTCPELSCPYGHSYGFASTVLYVYNWTQ